MSPGDGKNQYRLISLNFESKRLLWKNREKCIKHTFVIIKNK